MGECRGETVCVCVFFPGHVFSYYTQECGAIRGQTGTNWLTVLVVGSSSWQGSQRAEVAP